MAGIIIIGAGAAGLYAARELSEDGSKITLLEASNRIGGRIHTIFDSTYDKEIELGAEFIHGDLKITLGLLKKYALSFHSIEGEIWRFEKGKRLETDDQTGDEYGSDLEEKLSCLKHDIPVNEFLELNFSGPKYEKLRNKVHGFVEGYAAADTTKASTFAFRTEWRESDLNAQYRIDGGYGTLMKKLYDDCINNGADVVFNSIVKEVIWKKGSVEIITGEGKVYRGEKVITTVPLNLLKQGRVKFCPEITEKNSALEKLECGGVIKFLLQFDKPFWNDKNLLKTQNSDRGELMFIFSDAPIGTWWTQAPEGSALLTGYLSGPKADALKGKDDKELFILAMKSLQEIFQGKAPAPRTWRIANWITSPFSSGAYSYRTVNDTEYRTILSTPTEETLYFAGEALSTGKSIGTVEAAFETAKNCVRMISGQLDY